MRSSGAFSLRSILAKGMTTSITLDASLGPRAAQLGLRATQPAHSFAHVDGLPTLGFGVAAFLEILRVKQGSELRIELSQCRRLRRVDREMSGDERRLDPEWTASSDSIRQRDRF